MKSSFPGTYDLSKETNTLKQLWYTIYYLKMLWDDRRRVIFSKIREDFKEAVVLELSLKEYGE